jgi:hypothetical protein
MDSGLAIVRPSSRKIVGVLAAFFDRLMWRARKAALLHRFWRWASQSAFIIHYLRSEAVDTGITYDYSGLTIDPCC